MKLKKIFIPMLAFVFAIGMSFTTEKPVTNLWADMGGVGQAVETEEDCGDEVDDCYGELEEGGTFQLYHDQALLNPIKGAGRVIKIEIIPNP